MPSGQVIQLVNEGDTTFKDMYNSHDYIIPPGGQIMVDFDVMCLWLGHPDANDYDPRNRVRVAEYHRLRTRYGVDAATLEMSLAKLPVDADSLFQSMRPKLAAYDPTTSTRILTVADDPSGDSLTPSTLTSDADSQSVIMARMQAMENEMNALRAQLAINARAEQSRNDAQPISTDNPDMADVTAPLRVGGAGIVGTIQESVDPSAPAASGEPSTSPRPAPRTTPGEDTPTRVRVSQG